MSEGPPKKPEAGTEPVEAGPIDTQQIFTDVIGIVYQLQNLPLPGSANRALNALEKADENLEYVLRHHFDPGTAYITYLRAIEAVLGDEALWTSLQEIATDGSVRTARTRLEEHKKALESIQIAQFEFKGRMQ